MANTWYYTIKGSDKKGPVDESEIRNMLNNGTMAGSDLVWSEGMSDWVTADSVPEFKSGAVKAVSTAAPATASDELPPGLLGWMSFVGVMTILTGVFNLCNLLR